MAVTATARRSLSAVQLALGLATLTRPRDTATVLTPGQAAVPDLRIVRVLGARQVVQGAIGLARPSAAVASTGAAVDALHALSLLPIIVFSRRYRASASVSAGLATAASVAGVLAG